MEAVTQLNVTVPNAPSSLAKVGDKLRAANVNISAISCTEGHPSTVIHLIVDDPETAKIVLKELWPVSATDVLALKMKNTPGAIAAIGRECAIADLNIRMIYATTCGKEATVYVSFEDVSEALEKLKSWKGAH